MTLPKAESDKLIFVASFSLMPVACVLDCRSEPAKSTRLSLPALKRYLFEIYSRGSSSLFAVPAGVDRRSEYLPFLQFRCKL